MVRPVERGLIGRGGIFSGPATFGRRRRSNILIKVFLMASMKAATWVTCQPTQVNAPRLNLSQYKAAGTRFTYPGGMEGCYPAMHRPGVELAISRSQVRRPNHYTTEPTWQLSDIICSARTLQEMFITPKRLPPTASACKLNSVQT